LPARGQPGQPGLPPPPHRPLADPQLGGDHRGRHRCWNVLAASSRACSRHLRPRWSARHLAHTACTLHTATGSTRQPPG